MAVIYQIMVSILLITITIAREHSKRIRREPNIEVYGLPKHWLKTSDNPATEHVHFRTRLGDFSEEINESDDDSFDDTNLVAPVRPRPIIHARPYQIIISNHSDVDGVLERVSIPFDNSSLILRRRQRSTDNFDAMDLDDLEVAEGKIFRPLFVYRQQAAERHKRKRSQNSIQSAYQYRLQIKKHKY